MTDETFGLARGDNPDGVYQPRYVAEQGQEDVQPKGQTKADLEEHPERRNDHGKNDSQAVHTHPPWVRYRLFYHRFGRSAKDADR